MARLAPGGQRLPAGLDDAGDVCPAGQEQADALPGGDGRATEDAGAAAACLAGADGEDQGARAVAVAAHRVTSPPVLNDPRAESTRCPGEAFGEDLGGVVHGRVLDLLHEGNDVAASAEAVVQAAAGVTMICACPMSWNGHGPVSEPLKSLLAVSATCPPMTCSIWTRSRTVSMAAMVVMLLSSC
jgi:hypothetical protein